jgi:hypothetical protein
MRDTRHKCLSCGGVELHLGRSAAPALNKLVLTADSWTTDTPIVPLEVFVCLTCGYVGHFVSESDLATLRSRVESLEADGTTEL